MAVEPCQSRYRYQDRDLDQPGPVEQPAGAFLMMRRDVWKTLGGFDESFYPVWFEDVDFCKRALDAGLGSNMCHPVAAAHWGGTRSERISAGMPGRVLVC